MHPDGFELTDDTARLNVELVHHWLATDTYWARGRPLEVLHAAIAGSTPYGVYRRADGRQVAFARVVSDGEVFAYLCDVYVDRDFRGAGLGSWLVACVRDELARRGLRRFLLTTWDAQGVYARLGFAAVAADRWMECDLQSLTVTSDTSKE
jgi:GNAT superfamily N-acetyltransferase